MTEHTDALREQAENERANAKELGNTEAVKAAQKRLDALGTTRDEAPVEAEAPKSRQQKRA